MRRPPVHGETWALPRGSRERWVDDYERGRPGWPASLIAFSDVAPSAHVLDLGAGTGKLTRLLLTSFERVSAVEPQPAMRAALADRCPGALVVDGTGTSIPISGASIDAVFVAQAFHWFATPDAVAEIARVLRPGGRLVLMWNVPAGPWHPSVDAAETLLRSRAPSEAESGVDPLDLSSRHANGDWRAAFDGSGFIEARTARLPNPQSLDRDGLVAYFASMGWLAELPDTERIELLDEARATLNADTYAREWQTLVWVATKRA